MTGITGMRALLRAGDFVERARLDIGRALAPTAHMPPVASFEALRDGAAARLRQAAASYAAAGVPGGTEAARQARSMAATLEAGAFPAEASRDLHAIIAAGIRGMNELPVH